MPSKTFVFDFFLKTSNINIVSMRKINNFNNNVLKNKGIQKTFKI